MVQKNENAVRQIRAFNRYYTNVLGLLDQHILKSGLSLSEARVLYEISQTPGCTSKMLAAALQVNPGYISRILKELEKSGLLEKKTSDADGRIQVLTLTKNGEKTLSGLNQNSDSQILSLIRPLTGAQQGELLRSMAAIQTILTAGSEIRPEEITLRSEIQPGDIGYLTFLHGWVYKEEYHYNETFEAYVAHSFYELIEKKDPEKSRLWCAEHNGRTIGCIGIVSRGERAQLRWFLLDPLYRGVGLGKKLLQTALGFAKEAGFQKVYLETTDDLQDAIRMYEKAGFRKCAEKPNHSWREDLTELEFEMEL